MTTENNLGEEALFRGRLNEAERQNSEAKDLRNLQEEAKKQREKVNAHEHIIL